MALSSDLISQFVKVTNDEVEPKQESTVYGTIITSNGESFVQLDGSDLLTPISSTASIINGDRVLVMIKDHTATVTGNLSDHSASSKSLESVGDKVNEFDTIIADKVDTNYLTANYATIGELSAQTARIDTLNANTIKVGDLDAESGTFKYLSSTNLDAKYATVGQLTAESGRIDTLESTTIKASDITSDTGTFNYLTTNNLNAGYAKIDLANVNNAWIQNGVIKDAAIGDAQIIGVSANKLTAGTIDASKITVTNLNADNLTVGTINGARIGDSSIDLSKLSTEVPTKEYLDELAENMQNQIDGAIQTWTSDAVPTLNNYPASNWTTNDIRKTHVGDILYVINTSSSADGYCYRFAESSSGAYSWVLIKDSDVTKALQDLVDAQGDISNLKTFETNTSKWIEDTDEALSTIYVTNTSLSTTLGNYVESSSFNSKVESALENSATITGLTEKLDIDPDTGEAFKTLSNRVSAVEQTADGFNVKVSSLKQQISGQGDNLINDSWTGKPFGYWTSGGEWNDDGVDYSVSSEVPSGTCVQYTTSSGEQGGLFLMLPTDRMTVGEMYTLSVYVKTAGDSYEIEYEGGSGTGTTGPGVNIFHNIGATIGKYINSSGEEKSYTGRGITDYLPVESGCSYVVSNYSSLGTTAATCFYDDTKTFVGGLNYRTETFTVPDSAVYMRFSYFTSDSPRIEKTPTATSNYEWQLQTLRFTLANDGDKVHFYPDTSNGNVTMYISSPLLVSGSAAGEWSILGSVVKPIAQDVSEIDQTTSEIAQNVSEINQTTSEISARVSSLEDSSGSLTSRVSTIEQTADGIKTTVSSMISGRNLFVGTYNPVSRTCTGGSNQRTDSIIFTDYFMGLETKAGRTVTLSFDWETTATSGTIYPQLNETPWGSMGMASTVRLITISSTNKSGHYSKTWLLSTSMDTSGALYTGINLRMDGVTGTVTISNCQMEFGNAETEWSYAVNHEDKVGKYNLISSINQSAEAITINANKVNLSGYATFTNLSTSGQTAINGANITTGTISANRLNVSDIFAKNLTATGEIYFSNGSYGITTSTGSNNATDINISSKKGDIKLNSYSDMYLIGQGSIHLTNTVGYINFTSPGNYVFNAATSESNYADKVKLGADNGSTVTYYPYLNTANLSTYLPSHISSAASNIKGMFGDYVVAQGGSTPATNGYWWYRKWNSGRAEVNGYLYLNAIACTTNHGGWYRSANITLPTWPFTFKNVPVVQYSFEPVSNGTGAFLWQAYKATANQPADVILIRTTSTASLTGYIEIYAEGNWK